MAVILSSATGAYPLTPRFADGGAAFALAHRGETALALRHCWGVPVAVGTDVTLRLPAPYTRQPGLLSMG